MKLKSTLLALACTIGLSAGSAIASEGVSSKTAPTKTVDVGGTPFVYRELGPKNGIPVVFLQHLGGSMDDWDPTVVDGIAKRHHVIVFDNKGVAGSGGATPTSMPEMGKDAVAFIHALGLRQVDLLGFSIGGFVAQSIAQTEPSLVHKLTSGFFRTATRSRALSPTAFRCSIPMTLPKRSGALWQGATSRKSSCLVRIRPEKTTACCRSIFTPRSDAPGASSATTGSTRSWRNDFRTSR